MFLLAVTTCLLAFSGFVQCEAEPSVEGGVLVLTQANFQTVIKDNEFILVEFCKYHSISYLYSPVVVYFFLLAALCVFSILSTHIILRVR